MGRRKIEIQPITEYPYREHTASRLRSRVSAHRAPSSQTSSKTGWMTRSHERNRSVTFLKRKNGLFKKAYELGVLCSVDVAVIIFEDRPGHDLKLHQYCSGNIREIVQRHVHHHGDQDIKGPADFDGAAGTRFDDDDDDPNMSAGPRDRPYSAGGQDLAYDEKRHEYARDGRSQLEIDPDLDMGVGVDMGMDVDVDNRSPFPDKLSLVPRYASASETAAASASRRASGVTNPSTSARGRKRKAPSGRGGGKRKVTEDDGDEDVDGEGEVDIEGDGDNGRGGDDRYYATNPSYRTIPSGLSGLAAVSADLSIPHAPPLHDHGHGHPSSQYHGHGPGRGVSISHNSRANTLHPISNDRVSSLRESHPHAHPSSFTNSSMGGYAPLHEQGYGTRMGSGTNKRQRTHSPPPPGAGMGNGGGTGGGGLPISRPERLYLPSQQTTPLSSSAVSTGTGRYATRRQVAAQQQQQQQMASAHRDDGPRYDGGAPGSGGPYSPLYPTGAGGGVAPLHSVQDPLGGASGHGGGRYRNDMGPPPGPGVPAYGDSERGSARRYSEDGMYAAGPPPTLPPSNSFDMSGLEWPTHGAGSGGGGGVGDRGYDGAVGHSGARAGYGGPGQGGHGQQSISGMPGLDTSTHSWLDIFSSTTGLPPPSSSGTGGAANNYGGVAVSQQSTRRPPPPSAGLHNVGGSASAWDCGSGSGSGNGNGSGSGLGGSASSGAGTSSSTRDDLAQIFGTSNVIKDIIKANADHRPSTASSTSSSMSTATIKPGQDHARERSPRQADRGRGSRSGSGAAFSTQSSTASTTLTLNGAETRHRKAKGTPPARVTDADDLMTKSEHVSARTPPLLEQALSDTNAPGGAGGGGGGGRKAVISNAGRANGGRSGSDADGDGVEDAEGSVEDA